MVVLLLDKILQQTGHETGTYILEGEGRTMKQLQGVDIILYIHHWTVELQGVVNYIVQCIRINVFAKEGTCHSVGNLLKTHLLDVVEKLLWQFVDTLGHIESAIFCQSLYYCFVQVGNGSLAVSAVIFHIKE